MSGIWLTSGSTPLSRRREARLEWALPEVLPEVLPEAPQAGATQALEPGTQ
jgi:hypothetical protein